MVLDRRREDAARYAQSIEVQLRGAVDHVADLFPVHQIDALQYRNTREVGEAGIDQIEAVVGADDARIRMEAGQDRITVMTGGQRRFKSRVVTGVFKPVEEHRRRRRGAERWRSRQQQEQRGNQQTHQGTSAAVKEISKGPAGAPLLSRSVQIGPSAQQ
ncbi:hypothetical protein D3C71_1574860 [compost metagenome]